MRIDVLAWKDRADEPPAERQPPHAVHPQRVARDFDDDRACAFLREMAEASVHLWWSGCGQSRARIAEAAVSGTQRPDHTGRVSTRLEQCAKDLARARLAERRRQANQRELRRRRLIQARGQIRQSNPGGRDADAGHAERHGARPLNHDGLGALRDRVGNIGVPVEGRARNGDEEHPSPDPTAVLRDPRNLRIDVVWRHGKTPRQLRQPHAPSWGLTRVLTSPRAHCN